MKLHHTFLLYMCVYVVVQKSEATAYFCLYILDALTNLIIFGTLKQQFMLNTVVYNFYTDIHQRA